jgi:hypothetical protein
LDFTKAHEELVDILGEHGIGINRKSPSLVNANFMLTSISLTGKSLSEALLFAEHGENMLCTEIVLNVKNNFCT